MESDRRTSLKEIGDFIASAGATPSQESRLRKPRLARHLEAKPCLVLCSTWRLIGHVARFPLSVSDLAIYHSSRTETVQTMHCDGEVQFQGPISHFRRFCLKGNSSRDRAQFTVTVTAVVALMAPLEPVTMTV